MEDGKEYYQLVDSSMFTHFSDTQMQLFSDTLDKIFNTTFNEQNYSTIQFLWAEMISNRILKLIVPGVKRITTSQNVNELIAHTTIQLNIPIQMKINSLNVNVNEIIIKVQEEHNTYYPDNDKLILFSCELQLISSYENRIEIMIIGLYDFIKYILNQTDAQINQFIDHLHFKYLV